MRVLFLNPPYTQRHFSRSQRSPAVTKSGTLYYPYWLAHAAAVIDEKTPHDMLFIDAPADDLDFEETMVKIKAFRPEVAVLDTSTASIYNDVKYVEQIKAAFPDCFAILVGTHVSGCPRSRSASPVPSTRSRGRSTTTSCGTWWTASRGRTTSPP
jgi:hypothetical protein